MKTSLPLVTGLLWSLKRSFTIRLCIVRVGDESEQKFQNKPVCCLGGVKVRATWQPADSRRTVGGAMILLIGVAKMGLW